MSNLSCREQAEKELQVIASNIPPGHSVLEKRISNRKKDSPVFHITPGSLKSAQKSNYSSVVLCLSSFVKDYFVVLSCRLERERLSEKLRQKEVLERELNRERAALQEQLIKQAKLNEIIRQKDLFEKELRKEKNELQVI